MSDIVTDRVLTAQYGDRIYINNDSANVSLDLTDGTHIEAASSIELLPEGDKLDVDEWTGDAYSIDFFVDGEYKNAVYALTSDKNQNKRYVKISGDKDAPIPKQDPLETDHLTFDLGEYDQLEIGGSNTPRGFTLKRNGSRELAYDFQTERIGFLDDDGYQQEVKDDLSEPVEFSLFSPSTWDGKKGAWYDPVFNLFDFNLNNEMECINHACTAMRFR